jgi:lipopolysaccharide/colanic/teichoic acid biosynthesis glycosyltransferase
VPPHKWDSWIAALCLVFFAPLAAVIYALLLVQGEAPFAVQRRVRADGTSCTVWRFRTARPMERPLGRPAGSARRRLLATLGAFLYWSRLEVLPTFYNVLRGDISLREMLRDI